MHMKWWQKLTHVRTIDAGTEPGGGDTNQEASSPTRRRPAEMTETRNSANPA